MERALVVYVERTLVVYAGRVLVVRVGGGCPGVPGRDAEVQRVSYPVVREVHGGVVAREFAVTHR